MEEAQRSLTQNNEKEFVNVQSVVLTGKGSFDYLKIVDWPLSVKCECNEVRVAVEYCGVNFADVYHIQGRMIECPVPYVLGLECTGKIIELGVGINDLNVGDRVVCYKPEAGLFREKVVVQRNQCFAIPLNISNKIACSLMANYLTAYFALFRLSSLRSGETVLIHSAAGGVGWAATQLASSLATNVRVLGTASTSKHEEMIKNGVNTPLTYENYYDQIAKPEIDVIIDNIGGENLKKSIALLKPLGRVVMIGANSVVQEDECKVAKALVALGSSNVPLHSLVMGSQAICGLHLGNLLKESHDTVLSAVQHIFMLCEQDLIKPRIHAVYPFHKAIDAVKELANRKNIGKVLLKVE